MHAFDLNYIEGNKIVVRRAEVGEIIYTLDGQERKLIMICLLYPMIRRLWRSQALWAGKFELMIIRNYFI